MSDCSHQHRIQDFLDGELSDGDAREFRGHLAGCAACAAELAVYTRVFADLGRAPLPDPGPALTERILNRVAPSRLRRRRWVRALGWGYAAGMLGSLAALVVWLMQPGTLHAIALLYATASHRLVQLVVFAVNALSFATLSLAGGWSLLNAAGSWLAPLGRAMLEMLAHPSVAAALWPAAAACLAVLWWMRARGRAQGGRHVGVLGF